MKLKLLSIAVILTACQASQKDVEAQLEVEGKDVTRELLKDKDLEIKDEALKNLLDSINEIQDFDLDIENLQVKDLPLKVFSFIENTTVNSKVNSFYNLQFSPENVDDYLSYKTYGKFVFANQLFLTVYESENYGEEVFAYMYDPERNMFGNAFPIYMSGESNDYYNYTIKAHLEGEDKIVIKHVYDLITENEEEKMLFLEEIFEVKGDSIQLFESKERYE